MSPTIGKSVKYVDFGFTSACEFWAEVVVPAYERFNVTPDRADAIAASLFAWHVHEWIWHDLHPGVDTHRSNDYKKFISALFHDCPELAWIRDVAEAGKHRGLGRTSLQVSQVASKERPIGPFNTAPFNTQPPNDFRMEKTPLLLIIDDGSARRFSDVLLKVIDYWEKKYFL